MKSLYRMLERNNREITKYTNIIEYNFDADYIHGGDLHDALNERDGIIAHFYRNVPLFKEYVDKGSGDAHDLARNFMSNRWSFRSMGKNERKNAKNQLRMLFGTTDPEKMYERSLFIDSAGSSRAYACLRLESANLKASAKDPLDMAGAEIGNAIVEAVRNAI
jgi:hypothetical protein